MGTTTTALLLRPEGAWVGHVGDSRAYRVRNGQIEQMSFDHSLVWEMARRQGVDPSDLQGIPSNVIVRSLGPEPLVQVDVEGPHPLQPGDIFLLCSDGLSGQVTDAEIGAVAGCMPPAEACRFLVDLANLRGGPDNITVLIVRVTDHGEAHTPGNSSNIGWHRRVPWSLWTLLVGLLSAVDAVVLSHYGHNGIGTASYAFGAIAILVGLAGLASLYWHEKRRVAAMPHFAKPRLYRHATCLVNRELTEKLAQACSSLQQQVQNRQWEADWHLFDQHRRLAEEHVQVNRLPDAFCEYCRAMHVSRRKPFSANAPRATLC